MMKKILLSLLVSFAMISPVFAQEPELIAAEPEVSANVYFFHSDSCPHCKDEMAFLIELSKQEPYLDVAFHEFEVTQNEENLNLLIRAGEELDVDVTGVPVTVIGSRVINGYRDESSTGVEIQNAIDYILKNGDVDLIGGLMTGQATIFDSQDTTSSDLGQTVNVPVFGEVSAADVSLPLLSITLGFIDGFNPCAMWVLVFLISLMMGMKDRKRMWILGTTFIVASAAVYYVFMAAWLNVLMFIGLLFAVRVIIGLVAIGGGAYSIHDFYTNKDAECKVGDLSQKQKTMEKMKAVVRKPSFLAAFFGIIILAAGVNMVELVCSAGIPAVFTQVLNMSDITSLARYGYMLIYILLYMIDDIAVFAIAMMTLQITGVTAKYTRATRLIGGVIMILIGILMILKPELLAFA